MPPGGSLKNPVKTVVPGEGYRRAAASVAAHANWRQAEVAKGYARKARECDAAVPGDDTPFTDKLKSYGTEGRVLGPTVGCWCETSSDFDLLVELIAHVLADKETSVVRVAHHQELARKAKSSVRLAVCRGNPTSPEPHRVLRKVTNAAPRSPFGGDARL